MQALFPPTAVTYFADKLVLRGFKAWGPQHHGRAVRVADIPQPYIALDPA